MGYRKRISYKKRLCRLKVTDPQKRISNFYCVFQVAFIDILFKLKILMWKLRQFSY